MKTRVIGVILLLVALATAGGVAFYNSKQRQIPIIFSDSELLSNVWRNYKASYLEPTTFRTLDKQRDNITTSEGESYTMLRAVWMDDKTTFDESLKWTTDNLHRPNDALFSWLFGQRSDGSYGIETDKGGANTAADGDTDIALSLLMAHGRWNQGEYLLQAKAIINDIWKNEVVQVNGKSVLASNNLEQNSTGTIVVNPSYFSPYAYRLFAKVDQAHDWMGVVDSSYSILNDASTDGLNTSSSSSLPPNWVLVDRQGGSLHASPDATLDTNYGYDAMRIPWRIALDYTWNQNSAAAKYLDRLSFLGAQWQSAGKLSAVYKHNGDVMTGEESPAMYGSSMGYFLVADPKDAQQVFSQKLATLYNPDKDAWVNVLGYYDDNWAWFGVAMATHQLPNLTNL